MKILLFAGSLRKSSLNRKLVKVATQIVSDHQTTNLDLQSLKLPVYDGDIESEGLPAGVTELGEALKKADAVIISSPEYNGSISSPLKNTIDWASRLKPHPWEKKPILLLAASPGGFGGIRGLNHAKVPLEALGAYVFPTPFALAKAHEAFTEEGALKDDAQMKRLKELIGQFLEFAGSFK